MEFVLEKEFTHPELLKKRSNFSNDKNLRISCSMLDTEEQVLWAGLSDGRLIYWHKRGLDHHILKNVEHETKEVVSKQAHKGEIKALLGGKIFGKKYLFTGSVDHSIKIWENDPKSKEVVQTLVGHGGTIFALEFIQNNETLVSGSSDKTIRVWRQEQGREWLFYPFFTCSRVISNLSIKRVIEKPVHISTFSVTQSENFTLFAGDTDGGIHMLVAEEYWKKDSPLQIEKTTTTYHRLTVIQILLITKENIIFSIGYDQQLVGFEAISGKQFYELRNPHKVLFTSLVWDDENQELYASDELGYIFVVNMAMEKSMVKYRVLPETKIIKMIYVQELKKLLVLTETKVKVFRIIRSLKAPIFSDGHKGPVLSCFAIDPDSILKKPSRDNPRLVSAGLDNTIRVWDIAEMSLINLLEIPQNSEICCMSFLKKSSLFATGHEDGTMRLWNVEINSMILLDQSKNGYPKSNTICCITNGVLKESEFLFASGYDGKISVWEIYEPKSQNQTSILGAAICPQLKNVFYARRDQQTEEIGHEILCLLYDETRNWILAAGNSKVIYVLSMFGDFETQAILKGHTDSVNCMTTDKNFLFSGSDDKHILIWNLLDFELVSSIEAHTDSIRQISIMEDTGYLTSCSYDGYLSVWDYPRKKRVQCYAKKSPMTCFAYFPSQKTVFVGTESENVVAFLIGEKPAVADVINDELLSEEHKEEEEVDESFN